MSKNISAKKNDAALSLVVKIVALVCALVLLASIALAVVAKNGYFRRNTVVMEIGDTEINAIEYNYGYYTALNNFYSQYYYYASSLGFDPSTSLKSQDCYFDPEISWYDYFVNQTKTQFEEIYLIYNKAVEDGFTMTEESAKSLEDSIKDLENAAKEAKMSVNKYLRSVYGPNITLNDYKEYVSRRLIFADFCEKYMDGLSYPTEEIEKYYSDNKKDLDVVSYYVYTAKADTKNEKTAEEIANGIKDASTDVTSFLTALKGVVGEDTFEEKTYLTEGATYTKDDQASEWLFDDARKAGDVTVIKTAATSSASTDTYKVICFVERGWETYRLATMRHILLSVTNLTNEDGSTIKDESGKAKTNDAEQKAAAEALLKQWKDGAATQDSFAALVKDNSNDTGSVENGGLYEDFDKKTMVSEITDWIWAEGRKEGDCEIVKTSYGYHLVYFVGYGEEKWNSDVVKTLKNNDYSDYLKELKEKYPVSFNDKGLSQVG
ncbi:MAG: peptidyl-prolyl cis-trans isomerase [Clostridia bacterium]|nr:peptidyl-prolyl cis-trans isomerase [Clostridia bacterium]